MQCVFNFVCSFNAHAVLSQPGHTSVYIERSQTTVSAQLPIFSPVGHHESVTLNIGTTGEQVHTLSFSSLVTDPMPLNAAHEALSNVMFGPCNWENKDDLTDDNVAAYAREYIEDLDKEINQFEAEITLSRRSTETLRRERDEAEAAIVDFVDNLRRMEVRVDDIRKRKAFPAWSGRREQLVNWKTRGVILWRRCVKLQ